MIRTLHRTLSILCLSAFVSSTLSAREIYVDASATGAANGTNWADAYTNMRDAVADANGASMADNIHVSAGHYVSLSPYMITEPCTVRGHGSGAVIFESLALAAPIFRIDRTDIHFFNVEFNLSATHVYGYQSGVRFDRCEFTLASLSSVVGDRCHLMQFKYCKFYKNSSPGPGGAILSNDSRLVAIHDSEFCKNNSLGSGGAVHGTSTFPTGNFELHNTRFTDNHAASDGGGLSLSNTNATLINNVLLFNRAFQGGAIAFQNVAGYSTLRLINSTVFRNQAINTGGISCSSSFFGITHCRVANSIVYSNASAAAPTLLQQFNQPPNRISHSCVAGWGSLPWPGFAVIASPPALLPSGRPTALSPCIDTGNARFCPLPYDITGSPRVIGPNIDMGAYER